MAVSFFGSGARVIEEDGLACVNDEDLLRVQTPLTILNDFPPFNRTNNKWEQIPLPAVAGVEGVGIVVVCAKNVGRIDGELAKLMSQLPRSRPWACLLLNLFAVERNETQQSFERG